MASYPTLLCFIHLNDIIGKPSAEVHTIHARGFGANQLPSTVTNVLVSPHEAQ